MSPRPVLVLLLLICGCVRTISDVTEVERRQLWAQPGAPQVYSWITTIRRVVTEMPSLFTNHTDHNDHNDRSTPLGTRLYRINPGSGAQQFVAKLPRDGGEPYFYDGARDVLWVIDRRDPFVYDWEQPEPVIHAVAAPGHHVASADGQVVIYSASLPAPFVLARGNNATVLYDLTVDSGVALPGFVKDARADIDGTIVRFSRVTQVGSAFVIRQVAVDWATGHPQRLPDLVWQSPPLVDTVERLGLTVVADGKRVAEVVRDANGARFVIYDLTMRAPARSITIAGPSLEFLPRGLGEFYKVSLEAIAGDALIFGWQPDMEPCRRGAVTRIDKELVVPLSDSFCVTGLDRTGLVNSTETYVDHIRYIAQGFVGADAHLVAMPVRASRLVTGPTSFAYLDPGAIVEVELATGIATRRPLPALDENLRMIGLTEKAVFVTDEKRVGVVAFDQTATPTLQSLPIVDPVPSH